MSDLHDALKWRLLSGSHAFPGPAGGTCINEAALVVAGFLYRKVRDVNDMPECFSRPISAYALRLNDRMPSDLLQELLIPFVVRLAGTADTPKIERERTELIVVRTVSTILPIVLRLHHLEDMARLCQSVRTCREAYATANRARDRLRAAADAAAYAAAKAAAAAAKSADAADATYTAAATAYTAAATTYTAAATAYAADAADATATAYDAADAAYAADAAAYTATLIRSSSAEPRRTIWTAAVSILDAALNIGRQAEPIETAVVMARAEKAKRGELV